MLKAPELSPPGAGETQNGASGVQPEIAICIITYRRPAMLEGLLAAIERLQTGNLFRVSVAVVDNDREQSAREVVARAAARSSLRIRYDVEPEQNLSLARNRSVRNASGEYVAFIDDDEVPPPGWLAALFQTLQRFKVDGVLGPVYPRYEVEPPAWLVRRLETMGQRSLGTLVDLTNLILLELGFVDFDRVEETGVAVRRVAHAIDERAQLHDGGLQVVERLDLPLSHQLALQFRDARPLLLIASGDRRPQQLVGIAPVRAFDVALKARNHGDDLLKEVAGALDFGNQISHASSPCLAASATTAPFVSAIIWQSR
jgi:hypothetical protein